MLVHAAHQVTCYTKIQCSVSTAGEEVYTERQLSPGGHSGAALWAGPGTYEHGSRTRKHKKLQNCLKPVCMGSGLAALLRPGMTLNSYFNIQKKLFKKYWVQISPVGILFFDETDFPVSPPFLERLLTSNG